MESPGEKYRIHRAAKAHWTEGLRDFFEYRDLELGEATSGAFHAQVIKARRAYNSGMGVHKHDVTFHWVYVVTGTVSFDFKDIGLVELSAGDCHYMPAGIHHELMSFSADLEMIEMHAPGQIKSIEVPDFMRLGNMT